jgi:Cupin
MTTGWPLALVLGLPSLPAKPCAPHVNLLTQKIQIVPLQAEALADPKPGGGCEQRQGSLQQGKTCNQCKGLLWCKDYRLVIAGGLTDAVIFPHGDPHIIENGRPIKTVDLFQELARIFFQRPRLARAGGGGDVTKFVCGYMACEPRLSQVFLSGLPPLFKVSIRNDASG